MLLAGGSSRRLGGVDKPLLMVGGRSLLERAVHVLVEAGAEPVVIVGPLRHNSSLPSGVLLAQETPNESGPASAAVAGARALEVDDDQLLLIAGADLPLMGSIVPHLVAAAAEAVAAGYDGVVATAGGRDHYLLQCVRRDALIDAVGSLDVSNWSMKQLTELLRLVPLAVDTDSVTDADTWQAVAQLRQSMIEEALVPNTAHWVRHATSTAGVGDLPLDIDAILSLARDAAHGVERPAAPITTFILGFAAASRQLDAAGVAELAAHLGREALEFDNAAGDDSRNDG